MKKIALMLLLLTTTVLARAQYAQIELINHTSYIIDAKLYGNAPAPMPVCTLGPQTDFLPISTTAYTPYDATTVTYLIPAMPPSTVFNTILLKLNSSGSLDLSRFSLCSLPSSGMFYFSSLGIWINYSTTVTGLGVLQINLY